MDMNQSRLYSLFERKPGERRWQRVSAYAFTKSKAVRWFQNDLLAPILQGLKVERMLRVVDDEKEG